MFQQLGINTVRVYTVDNTANHDTCMNALSAAGIYVALDVNNGLYSINRADPQPSYNAVYLQSVFATIDAFAGYENTLLFFSGNEVVNAPDNTNDAPYVRIPGQNIIPRLRANWYIRSRLSTETCAGTSLHANTEASQSDTPQPMYRVTATNWRST